MSLEIRLAKTKEEREAAYNVRYKVFVDELKTIPKELCKGGLEKDIYDNFSEHLIAVKDKEVIGTVRIQKRTKELTDGKNFLYGLAGENLFDYLPFYKENVNLGEIARSSVLKEHRKESVIFNLWKATYQYFTKEGIYNSITMAAPNTDSIEDSKILYEIARRKGLVHDKYNLIPKNSIEIPSKIEVPLYSQSEKDDISSLELPENIVVFSKIGYKIAGHPIYYPKFRRVTIPMVCSPQKEVSDKFKKLFSKPSNIIKI